MSDGRMALHEAFSILHFQHAQDEWHIKAYWEAHWGSEAMTTGIPRRSAAFWDGISQIMAWGKMPVSMDRFISHFLCHLLDLIYQWAVYTLYSRKGIKLHVVAMYRKHCQFPVCHTAHSSIAIMLVKMYLTRNSLLLPFIAAKLNTRSLTVHNNMHIYLRSDTTDACLAKLFFWNWHIEPNWTISLILNAQVYVNGKMCVTCWQPTTRSTKNMLFTQYYFRMSELYFSVWSAMLRWHNTVLWTHVLVGCSLLSPGICL